MRTTLGWWMILFLALPFASAETWKVGLAKRNITPTEPMWMAGYASRTQPAKGKVQDLWLRVMALEDATGREGVIVSADVVGISRGVWDEIIAQLGEDFDRSQLMFNTSHTHSGPVFGQTLADMYPLDEEQRRRVDAYTRFFVARSLEAIAEARAQKKPARLAMGVGQASFAVNRRNNPEGEVPARRAAGSLVGPVDHSVPVLRVTDATGEIRCLLFAYACHNTVLDGYDWSGDYAGFAQDRLESDHPGVQAMFVAGCGGDQNPLPRRKLSLAQDYGTLLAGAVEQVLKSTMTELAPSLDTRLEMVSIDLGPRPTREELQAIAARPPDYQQRWGARLLAETNAGTPTITSYSVPVESWKIGSLDWVTIGGETVVDYSLKLKGLLGPNVWVTSYSNDVMAYIPSLRVLREGGYEGQSSMIPYGMPAYRWGESIEDRLTDSVLRLVRGRGVPQP